MMDCIWYCFMSHERQHNTTFLQLVLERTEHPQSLLVEVSFGDVSYVDEIDEKDLSLETANRCLNSSSGATNPSARTNGQKAKSTYPKSLVVVIQQSTRLVFGGENASVCLETTRFILKLVH